MIIISGFLHQIGSSVVDDWDGKIALSSDKFLFCNNLPFESNIHYDSDENNRKNNKNNIKIMSETNHASAI